MTSILRIYDPSERDDDGTPLDWDRCRMCHLGIGLPGPSYSVLRPGWLRNGSRSSEWGADIACPGCGGHGSLKAAALAALEHDRRHRAFANPFRCEDCGHPMSDGTWEPPDLTKRPDLRGSQWLWDDRAWVLGRAASYLRDGREPFDGSEHAMAHWSPCDEECRHYHAPGRISMDDGVTWNVVSEVHHVGVVRRAGGLIEASWRAVDVRTLSWPHDLRPERLAVLCLRCWAAR
jgi:hypothetical protein